MSQSKAPVCWYWSSHFRKLLYDFILLPRTWSQIHLNKIRVTKGHHHNLPKHSLSNQQCIHNSTAHQKSERAKHREWIEVKQIVFRYWHYPFYSLYHEIIIVIYMFAINVCVCACLRAHVCSPSWLVMVCQLYISLKTVSFPVTHTFHMLPLFFLVKRHYKNVEGALSRHCDRITIFERVACLYEPQSYLSI